MQKDSGSQLSSWIFASSTLSTVCFIRADTDLKRLKEVDQGKGDAVTCLVLENASTVWNVGFSRRRCYGVQQTEALKGWQLHFLTEGLMLVVLIILERLAKSHEVCMETIPAWKQCGGRAGLDYTYCRAVLASPGVAPWPSTS